MTHYLTLLTENEIETESKSDFEIFENKIKSILPPDIFERFRGGDYWRDASFAKLGISSCTVTKT